MPSRKQPLSCILSWVMSKFHQSLQNPRSKWVSYINWAQYIERKMEVMEQTRSEEPGK